MRFAASRRKPARIYAHGNTSWQQSCSHSTAICNHRFKTRIKLRTQEQPLVAEHRGGTNSRMKRPQPQPPDTGGTFQRRLQPLYTEKHKVSCSGFLPKQSPCDSHAAITMRFAASRRKPAHMYAHGNTSWQQSCSHSTAICNHRFKTRIKLRTQEQPLVAEHRGGTNSRMKRPQPQPPDTGGTFHRRLQPLCTEKHKVSCSGFLPKTKPIQHSCSHYNAFRSITFLRHHFPSSPLRFVTTSFLTTSLRHHFPSSPLPFLTTSLRHHFPFSPLPLVTTSLPHHFPSSPLPFITASPRHHTLSSPLPFVTTSLPHHFPSSPRPFLTSSPLPFITTSLRHHFPSSPLPFVTTSLPHHLTSSPLPFLTTSLPYHFPSSPLPFLDTSLSHHFPSSPLHLVTTPFPHHFPSSPLPFLTTSLPHHVPSSPRHHFPSSPLPFVTTSLPHHFPSSPLPFLTTSPLHHFPSSPLPFLTTSHPHLVTTSLHHHFPSSPLPFLTTSLPHHLTSSPLPFLTISLRHHSTALHQCQVSQFFLSPTEKYCFPISFDHTTICQTRALLQSAVHS